MSNLVRCGGCRGYKDREGMSKQGLGYLCGPECMELVKERARYRHEKRIKSPKVRPPGMGGDLRKRVRKRDGNACRWCFRITTLEVHHVEYRSQGGTNSIYNLITLCQEHHMEAHSDKGRWQPVLRGVLWTTYAGKFLTVPEVEKLWKRMQ
jgi:5-methylcytosine-specific restriction endonuclease McrA